MIPPPLPENPIDTEHLRILSIFYYIMAGLSGMALLFIIGHGFLMTMVFGFATNIETPSSEESQSLDLLEFAPILGLMGVFYIVIGLLTLAVGVMNFKTARFLRQRRGKTFTMVTAGINCLNFPFGTILGVFTFVVLSRPSVSESYRS